ncbi:hypothetical protein ACF8R4_00955 [Pseudomonas sp. FYR_2]|uniref:hypothetical protein n=1 Tax=Pseudomonas TaxID=286 RepID=UPI000760CFF9|nr:MULTISPECIES: hypothetical protein [Pseudomonas]MCE0910682.1 hypothetical protein [Pseudomonas kurunegalensis]QIG18030.1 hypothetical protein FY041_09740 [Pseudomonas monteilii]QIG23287.1 hypothetical protein FY043_09735 [Pseudomonas monteilii]WJR57778.1 hypothetical protein LU664_009535 [Pseudomonas kurunegalensis]
MNDAQAAMLLLRRLEGAARQPVLLHELEARLSADGRNLVLSRYRERYSAEGKPYRCEAHRSISIAALLRWMARHER